MKEIRDAVGWAKAEVELLYGYDDVLNKNTKEMLNILIDLAEKVLAAKMPEKKDVGEYDFETTGNEDDAYHYGMNRGEIYGYNEAIDACRIAITGALLSEEEIEDLLINNLGGDSSCDYPGAAQAIHSAQMEKLGGE